MQIKTMALGMYQANCYIISDEATLEAAIIDPGDQFELIKNYIDKNKLNIKYILLTHGHGDHIGALMEIKEYTKAPVCINKNDLAMLRNKDLNFSDVIYGKKIEMAPDQFLIEGEIITVGSIKIDVIHTPGHTKGSVCFKCGNILFTGDTLFAFSIGRTDLPGGNYNEIIEAISSKLLVLPEETVVYPGHGDTTTIGKEKRYNPFFQE